MSVEPTTKRGLPRQRVAPGTPMPERIKFHVRVDRKGCWNWAGHVGRRGYGRIYVGKKLLYAHRVSYEAFVGPIPVGLQIDHVCRNRKCVNPEHLEAVTPQINTLRSMTPGARAIRRGACKYGHPRSKYGYASGVRVYCLRCRRDYLRIYKAMTAGERAARKRAGLPVVDLAAFYAKPDLADTA